MLYKYKYNAPIVPILTQNYRLSLILLQLFKLVIFYYYHFVSVTSFTHIKYNQALNNNRINKQELDSDLPLFGGNCIIH